MQRKERKAANEKEKNREKADSKIKKIWRK